MPGSTVTTLPTSSVSVDSAREPRRLVHVQADAVAEAVAEVLAEAGGRRSRRARRVGVDAGHARADSRDRRELGLEAHVVGAPQLVGRSPVANVRVQSEQ